MNERLFAIIQRQQEGHENEPRFMIGEQLKEIAAREPGVSEILERDLEIPELSLEAAERKLQQYADQHHKGAKCFCITPKVAEGILREMYGLPGADAGSRNDSSSNFLDLSSFL
ncbi:MAG: hypothetical protein J6Z04_06660 [Clostridia bacterium]|nr:hypothetical protein [Clostridia bacterium]